MTFKKIPKSLSIGAIALLITAGSFSLRSLTASSTADVVGIEEDWEVTLLEPDAAKSAPQFGTQMNPDSTQPADFAVLGMNFQELPNYFQGGIQLQMWEAQLNTQIKGVDKLSLSKTGEVIQWTQSLTLNGSRIAFCLKNGISDSYGSFGGANFKVTASNATYTSLNKYLTSDSVKNSGITLGANRVKLMRITQVRKTLSDGQEEIDWAPKIIYQQPDSEL